MAEVIWSLIFTHDGQLQGIGGGRGSVDVNSVTRLLWIGRAMHCWKRLRAMPPTIDLAIPWSILLWKMAIQRLQICWMVDPIRRGV